MDKTINIATVFSGIGAPEQALRQLGIKSNIVFACDNGEIELDVSSDNIKSIIRNMSDVEKRAYIKKIYCQTGKHNYVKDSYLANYKINENDWHEDIRFLDGNKYQGAVDILVGGSPCQSFSIIGKRFGLDDTRGTLFYEFARLVKEIGPKVFIYENVPGMLTHDKGKTWEVIESVFNSLGYKISKDLLNSMDYGIPQNRKRLFVVGFKDQTVDFAFPKPVQLETSLFDYLENNNLVDPKHYLGEKGFKFVTSNPSRARVGTKIMGCQKANQQFNWNGDFIFDPLEAVQNRKDIMSRAYIGTWNGQTGVCRKYTPRECLRLMGFKDDFKIIHKDEVIYRQSGNSIVVNVLMELVKAIKATGVWDHD